MAMACRQCPREEFYLLAFGLGHDERNSFYRPQWRSWPRWLYPLYRGFLAVYMLTFLTAAAWFTVSGTYGTLEFFAFLTIWNYILMVIYQVYSFVVVVCMSVRSSANASPDAEHWGLNLPWFLKLLWLLYNISSLSSTMVIILYYALVFGYVKNLVLSSPLLLISDINLHAIPAVFVLFDLAICAIPLRVVHFIYALGFMAVYFIFSLIYWSFDKEEHVLYPVVLDWNTPGYAIATFVGSGIFAILVWLCLYGLYRLRRKIASENVVPSSDQAPASETEMSEK